MIARAPAACPHTRARTRRATRAPESSPSRNEPSQGTTRLYWFSTVPRRIREVAYFIARAPDQSVVPELVNVSHPSLLTASSPSPYPCASSTAASCSPSTRSNCSCSTASASLILLMAKPTWMSTRSPTSGGSSRSRPRSIRRRAPRTSTIAPVDPSAGMSTICPGIARHLTSLPAVARRSPCRHVALRASISKVTFIQLQRAARNGDRLDAEVRLSQHNLSLPAQRVANLEHRCRCPSEKRSLC
jgi:hypothetical protein